MTAALLHLAAIALLIWMYQRPPRWVESDDGSTRTDPTTGQVEHYEQCPSGWPGFWRAVERKDQA